MAELVDSGLITVEAVVKVTIDYDEVYLTQDAAKELRDELNIFLNRM